jgi:hypothetical protein
VVTEGRSLGGGRDLEAALAQAVALALEGDHGRVVDEPVDEGGGDHRVAEDLAPLLEAAVRGDADRAALGAAGDEREEQVGGLPLERQVADLVNDEQVVALQVPELLLELVAVLRLLKPGDPLLGGGEGDPVTVLARPQCQCGGEVGRALSLRPPEQTDGPAPPRAPTYPQLNRRDLLGGLIHEYKQAA